MSEHITHVGAFEDASRILLEVSDLDALFKESLETYYDTALCASASRGNHLFAVPHLQEVKQRRRQRGYVDESDRRLLASSLGWLMHRAVDHELDDAIVPQIEASLYARSLRDGYRAVEAAGAYFAEEIGRKEFLSRIG